MIETPINAHFYMIGWLWVITCIGREAQNIEIKVKSLRSPIHDLRSAGFCACEMLEVTRKVFDKAVNWVGASVGNKLRHIGLPIQRFHMLRLAQSHVTVANQIVYTTIAT